jgi:tRNA (guanine-N7-)-methyltransferase
MELKKIKWIGSFMRRKGRKLSQRQQDAMDNFFSSIEIIAIEGEPLAISDMFPDTAHNETCLEIGLGYGEHLYNQAQIYPNRNYIGCEPYINGVASVTANIQDYNIKNIRLFTDDARIILEKLSDNSIDKTYLLFPDPWPKQRQHHKRLISEQTLNMLSSIMKPNAEFFMATDCDNYAKWMIEHIEAHHDFSWAKNGKSRVTEEFDNWVITRYQQKAHDKGDFEISFLRFVRNE